MALFERAIALDPGYARAHAGLADTYRLLAQLGVMPQGDAIAGKGGDRARARARSELAEALNVAAVIAIGYDDDPRRHPWWERALELNPQLSEARVMYAEYGL